MLAKVLAGTNLGLLSELITIEVDVASMGLPAFNIVGLGDRAVDEAKERVRSALKNSGAEFPAKRITVNLAPADLPKNGPIFDLGMAIGLMQASGQLAADLTDKLILGELSLDGTVKPINGALSLVLMAKQKGYAQIILPADNSGEVAVVDGISIIPVSNFKQTISFLSGQRLIEPLTPIQFSLDNDQSGLSDFADIKGQETAKRVLEIAAAGGHNVLFKGPPGSGKTLLARSFASILPPLNLTEALELTQVYSVAGLLSPQQPLIKTRPFRSPHHSASYVGIVGGGHHIRPGEVSLAHRGVLFMDELPEFNRQVLEALRQPLEDGQVTVSRAQSSLTFPSRIILLAAHNPCPCGYYQTGQKDCICTPAQISHYQKKLSGPLLDRIDLQIEVAAVDYDKLSSDYKTESSKQVRQRVIQARQRQQTRFNDHSIQSNAEMTNLLIEQYCRLDQDSQLMVKLAMTKFNLSARSYHRLLKVARTIADLAGVEQIAQNHLAEALQYRQ